MPLLLRGLICLALLATPTLAIADVITVHEPDPCSRRQAGDACEGGTCQPAQCCERRRESATTTFYREKAERDRREGIPERPIDPATGEEVAGPAKVIAPPPSVQCRDCLKCIPDPSPATPDMSADAQEAPDITAPAPAAAQPEVVAQKTRGGMCATAPWSSDTGTWSLALGALLLVGLGARRKK